MKVLTHSEKLPSCTSLYKYYDTVTTPEKREVSRMCLQFFAEWWKFEEKRKLDSSPNNGVSPIGPLGAEICW